jgi:hypothetical protein
VVSNLFRIFSPLLAIRMHYSSSASYQRSPFPLFKYPFG